MAETAEIPEAKNPFEKRVAITIAIIAVVLSIIANHGERARTDAILTKNEATDVWSHYQAKGIKERISQAEQETLSFIEPLTTDKSAVTSRINTAKEEQARYNSEKETIKGEAEHLANAAKEETLITERCELAALILQIAIVLCSVAILSHWRMLWFVGICVAAAGACVGLSF